MFKARKLQGCRLKDQHCHGRLREGPRTGSLRRLQGASPEMARQSGSL